MVLEKTLTLYLPRTKTLCLGLWAAHFFGQGTYTMLSHKLHLDPFPLQTSSQLFILCHQMKTHEMISWWVFLTCHQP